MGGIFIKKIIILTILILGLLFLIDVFTLKNQYGGGNGNLSLVFIIPLIPLLFWYSVALYKLITKTCLKKLNSKFFFLLAILVVLFGTVYQYWRYIKIKRDIRELLIERELLLDEQYIESITSGLTSYTNTIFFGYIPFIMLIAFVYILAMLFNMTNKLKSEDVV